MIGRPLFSWLAEFYMPYGLIALIAAVIFAGKFIFYSEAPAGMKALLAGLVLMSLVWSYGTFLQAAIVVLLSCYFTYHKSRDRNR